MKLTLSEVAGEFATVIQGHRGEDHVVTGVSPAGACGPGDLVFAENEVHAKTALANRPSGLVIAEHLSELVGTPEGTGILISDNVRLAHALIKQRYGDRQWNDADEARIHPAAVVHPSARLASSCRVAANACIGEGAVLGERCRVLEGAVIESGAILGDDCVIHPNAVVGYNCQLGNDVEIGTGSVVGSEGYGFAQDKSGKSHRIPQTGAVIIDDRVRVGANNCIDRPPYGATRIGAGTKTDNLCHIAHGVEVGEDCLLTAFFCVAGSTKIGNRVMTSGQTGILDHLTICDDVVLAHRAAVMQDIEEPGAYAGLPLQPLKNHMKTMMQLKKLSEMSRTIKKLEREISALQSAGAED